MDKIIGFKEDNIDKKDLYEESDEESIDDYELTDEEREYLNSLTKNCKQTDILFDQENKLENLKKEQDIERDIDRNIKRRDFDQKKIVMASILAHEQKTWKSSRANKHKKENGKIIIEKRKFNPRPLPNNWEEILGCSKKQRTNNFVIEKITDYPTLGLGKPKIKKQLVNNFSDLIKKTLKKIDD